MNDQCNLPSIDQLIEIAKKDPEALEAIRQREVEAFISSAPQEMQRRLQGLQFQIDCRRRLHKDSAMGSCIAISQMMMDSLQHLNEALHGCISEDAESTPTSKILSFPATAS